jgi:hypothetical protein
LFIIGGFWRDEGEKEEDRPGVVGDSAEDTEPERVRPGGVMGIGREGGEAMIGKEEPFGAV